MNDYSYGVFAALGAFIFLIAAAAIVVAVFYLLTLQRALQAVSPENRKMEPGLVWLMFIPLFNIVWNFFVVDAIGISFQREYQKYGITQSEKPTYGLGLTMAILQCCGIIPFLGVLASLGALVVWIIYWVKVKDVKNDIINIRSNHQLEEGQTSIFV